MNVGFYNAAGADARHSVMGDAMIRSVRETMPGVSVTQLTDLTSPALHGVSSVIRRAPAPLALATARLYSELEGEWLLVDTDVLVQRDVRHVFDEPFDVAVVERGPTLVVGEMVPGTKSRQFIERMPHNIGVVFSRCPAFWAEVARRMEQESEKLQAWMGNQEIACQLIREGKWRIRVLPATYNWAPAVSNEDVSQQAIVHYKGPVRKDWMLRRILDEVVA